MTGLEPANDGITTRCRNHLATPAEYTHYTLKRLNLYVLIIKDRAY